MANLKLQEELSALKDPNTGLLVVETVEAWAREHPESELHKHLEWDDAKAGQQWRYQQIRQLVAVHYVDVSGERATISLSEDRPKPGGGYRIIEDVLQAPDLVTVMLDDAVRDMLRWVKKYEHLRELAGERTGELFDTVQSIVAELQTLKETRKDAAD